VWNEEETKNPIYLRILKQKNMPTTWKHILLQLEEEKVNPEIPTPRQVLEPATRQESGASVPERPQDAPERSLFHSPPCADAPGFWVTSSPHLPQSPVHINTSLDFQREISKVEVLC